MAVIVFASSKGGAGKTTAAVILASEFAYQGSKSNIDIGLIDADPNQHSAKWATKNGVPSNIRLISNSSEESIIDDIEEAEKNCPIVLVDLEGTASMTVASAISRADLVVTLCQGSQDDADEAVKTIKLIKRQEKLLRRNINSSVLFTRTNPAIVPRTLKHIFNEFRNSGIEMFNTNLIDREAFRAMRSFGGSIYDLNKKEVSGIDKAIANSQEFAREVKLKLKQGDNI